MYRDPPDDATYYAGEWIVLPPDFRNGGKHARWVNVTEVWAHEVASKFVAQAQRRHRERFGSPT